MVCTEKDAERYQKLFRKLDRNSDGKIDVNDLATLFDKHKNIKNKETSVNRAKVKILSEF